MGKSIFSTLLMGVVFLGALALVNAVDEDDDVHPLRTHSIYMPYIGKSLSLPLILLVFIDLPVITQPCPECGSKKGRGREEA